MPTAREVLFPQLMRFFFHIRQPNRLCICNRQKGVVPTTASKRRPPVSKPAASVPYSIE